MIAELAVAAVLASHYAGKPVTITCKRFAPDDPTIADIVPGGDRIDMSTRACRALRRPARTEQFALAVLTVIHEGFHARGDENEDRVECMAARRAPAALYRWFGMANTKTLVRRVSYRPECVR